MATPQSIVTNAVHEIREPSGDQQLIDALTADSSPDLIPEIAMWIEDVTGGMNVPRLISAAKLPICDDAQQIVEAVDLRGAKGLYEYEGNNPEKLVRMIAALQEAGESN